MRSLRTGEVTEDRSAHLYVHTVSFHIKDCGNLRGVEVFHAGVVSAPRTLFLLSCLCLTAGRKQRGSDVAVHTSAQQLLVTQHRCVRLAANRSDASFSG